MFEISYRYISSSNITARRFRFNLTARTAVGKVNWQIIEDRYFSSISKVKMSAYT